MGTNKFRIKLINTYDRDEYIIQKKSIFGYWYNPFFFDSDNGRFDRRFDAISAINRMLHVRTSKIVWTSNEINE